MKFAWVDDDREQLEAQRAMLQRALDDFGVRGGVRAFLGSADFLSAWQAGSCDVIVLDIYMDGMNGVELARRIRRTDSQAELVFCTSSNEFACESYEVEARYYLQKPVTPQKLAQMLRRLDLQRLEKQRSIQLPDGYRLLLRSLIYTNYINHSVTFYMQDMPPHAVYMAQAEAERLLSDACFYPVNKGSIVNFHMVRKVTEDSFVMKDGAVVPIARRRYKEVKEAFARFHFQKLSEEAEG